MIDLPKIFLKPGITHRVLKGHFWIYQSELAARKDQVSDGGMVDVFDQRERFIGRGYYNSRSQIAIRLLTRQSVELNEDFWRKRLDRAIAYRDERLKNRPARRLVSSEADLLPGLIVEQYGDQLVIQTTTLGMERLKDLWVRLLDERLRSKAILENNDTAVRLLEGLEPCKGYLRGQGDGSVRARVGRAEFVGNLLASHKTGFYLDQQLNYERVAEFVKPGMRVLDAFCHLAGFGIHALLAGAETVTAVDSSEESIDLARQSAALAGVAARVELRCENAFDFLRAAQVRQELFDLIVLDPPSFTRTRRAVPEALRGYKEIHIRALKLLKPDGILATFCCSHHLAREEFQQIILAAAADTGTLLRCEACLEASPDHPVLPAVPETEYLKGFIFSVVAG